jgi:Transposase, Mutator family
MPPTICSRSPASRPATGGRSGPPTPERLNKKIKRRTNAVGVFPNPEALQRLAGAGLVKAHDEWQTTNRRYHSEATTATVTTTPPTPKLITT